jgi:hypothetical protein
MFMRAAVVIGFLFVFSGCTYDEATPEIVADNSLNRAVLRPSPVAPRVPRSPAGNFPKDWLPPSSLERKWTAIVVHHSGTDNGNVAIFDKWAREGHHWEGIGYDFVIGNGTDSSNGRVEVTFRWRQQRTGAHCKTPDNWANEEAVGICLVGDFNRTVPTVRQVRSLVKLVRFLQRRYGISKSRIYAHNRTPGARVTDCPGRNLSIARLKSMLGS